jgi:formylglycine-generating enzyme
MKKLLIIFSITIAIFSSSCTQKTIENFILVEGGIFKNAKSNYYGKDIAIPHFYIGINEVTQKEWIKIMGTNPSEFKGDNLPVEKVSWYSCLDYCNKRSLEESLKPYYTIDKVKKDPYNNNPLDTLKWVVSVNDGANGYRLPTEAEWEYAAGGGQLSKSYSFSGSNNIEKVAWYWINAGEKKLGGNWTWAAIKSNGCKTKPIASKLPNELGIYNMSGNVREWCWDWKISPPDPYGRSCRGGGWIGSDFCCASSYRTSIRANIEASDTGFRVCRGD